MLRLIKLLQTAANSSSSSCRMQPLCAMLCLGFAPVSHTEANTAVQHWSTVRDTEPAQLKALSLTLQHTFAKRCVTVRRTAAPGCNTTTAAAAVALSAAGSSHFGSSSSSSSSSVNICVVSVNSRAAVLPTVLSAYVQQGRLPQPQEVLLCTEHTTQEDVALLLRRCVRAATTGAISAHTAAVHGPDSEGGYEETKECEPPTTTDSSSVNTSSNSRSNANSSQYESLFCIADAQALSYSAQVALVRSVQAAITDTDAALGGRGATLLIVSEPKQVVLSMLSAHAVELLPLSREVLAAACGPALLASCCGADSRAVLSEINGGGKSHRIMQLVGQWQSQQQQQQQRCITYHRVPLREEASAASLVAALAAAQAESAAVAAVDAGSSRSSSSSGSAGMAVHLDIGHVVPENAATLLFQLVVLGVLRDPVTSAVYSLYATDATAAGASQCTLLLEVPNSEGNAVAAALAPVCSLLPTEVLKVTAAALSRQRPERSLLNPTTVKLQTDAELHRACAWLRAAAQPQLDPLFESYTAAAIPRADRFALLLEHVCTAQGPCQQPSWSLLCTLARHLSVQFAAMEGYALLQDVALQGLPVLEEFRLAFARLLIATGKAFTLRALRQSESAALRSDAPWTTTATSTADATASGSHSEAAAAAAAAVVQRFKGIAAWDDTDHPLVLFKQALPEPYGDGQVSIIVTLPAPLLRSTPALCYKHMLVVLL
jgi:hypothetical protein